MIIFHPFAISYASNVYRVVAFLAVTVAGAGKSSSVG